MQTLQAEREASAIAKLHGFKEKDDKDVVFAGCYVTNGGQVGRVYSAPTNGWPGASVYVSFGATGADYRFSSLRKMPC
jgi:hypothetical protein